MRDSGCIGATAVDRDVRRRGTLRRAGPLLFLLAALALAGGLDRAFAGPAPTDVNYFDGFMDLTGIDPAASADVELDALGGVRMKGNGASQPAQWTSQADFGTSISYKPTLVVDNPAIPLATLDAATAPGSLVLPTASYAFRRDQDVVLAPADPVSADGYGVGGMCVQRVDLGPGARYYMWYTGVPENEHTTRIYLAKSDDGVAWVRVPRIDPDTHLEVPVLDVGDPGTFDSRELGKPSVLYSAGGSPKFKMWYSAEGDLTGSIGYATSEDGINWTKWEQPVVTVDGAGGPDVGSHASLAVGGDGLPIFAYYDATNGDLRFTRCGNAYCSAGNTTLSLDMGGDVGRFASLAVAGDGYPVIAYYDATNGDLKVIHCGNAACAAGNTVTTVDGGGVAGPDVGQHASLAVDANGYPLIAYYDVTNGALKFVKCADYSCVGSAGSPVTPVTLDGAAVELDAGQYASLGLNGQGNPVVAYYDVTNATLRVLACNDPACADGDEAAPVSPDLSGNDVGQYASLAVSPLGNPVVAYYDATATALKLLVCDDPACAGANDAVSTIDNADATDTGKFCRVAFDPLGFPVVAYYDATNLDLRAIACDDGACAGGDASFLVDGAGDVGQYASLAAFPDGRMRLAYYDLTNGDLKFTPTQRTPEPVLGPGTIGNIDSYSVSHPSVILENGIYRMWYTANDSNNRRIAYASSTDGVTWARGGKMIDVGTGNIALGVWSPSVTARTEGQTTYYDMVFTGWKSISAGMAVQAKLMGATSTDGTNWTYGSGNIALNTGGKSDFDGYSLSQPAIIYDPADAAAPYKMWYVGNNPDANGNFHDRIGFAKAGLSGGWTRVDGTAGEKAVLGFGTQSDAFDSMYAFDLRVVVPDSGTPLSLLGFFTGTKAADFKERIGLKQSSDGGFTWADHTSADPLVNVGALDTDFDFGGVLTPAPVFKGTGQGWLIYHTALSASRAPVIALHTANDDLSAVVRETPAVLGAGTGFDAGGCADPYVVGNGTALTMYYAGVNSGGVWSIGKATGATTAPKTFAGRAQILAPGPGTYDSGGLRRPVVRQVGATWHLWYTAIGSDGVERIAHAQSADGTTWTKDGLAVNASTTPYDFAEKGVWPGSAWLAADNTTVNMTVTGLDRFGWRRTGLLSAAGPGRLEGATATYQTPDDAALANASYLPRDWRKISWNPVSAPDGSELEVWVSYYPTYSNRWSNFFRIGNGVDLPFLRTVKGMRWQVRAAGHATDTTVTPQVDDLAVDNAPFAFPASATATTIPIGPSPGNYLVTWGDLTVKSDIPAAGSLKVKITDETGVPIAGIGELSVSDPEWVQSLAAIPGTSGRLRLAFTFTPDTGALPPQTPLLQSVNVGFTSTTVPSSITLAAAPNPLPAGQSATLSGWLTSNATPLQVASVTILSRGASDAGYTPLGTVPTGADGSFTWSSPLSPANDTLYRAEWIGGNVGGTVYPPAVGMTTLTVNYPPVADSQSVTVVADTPRAITLTGSDPDGDNLTYTIVTGPVNGSLTGNAPALTYTPTPGFTGSADSFTFKVGDGQLESAPATVTITIAHPPVLNPIGNRTTRETKRLAFTLTATDPDGSPLTFSAVGLPLGATLNRTTGAFVWMPGYTQSGTYAVTFRVSDGVLTDEERVVITVINQVLFYDDFTHGTTTGDRDWTIVAGAWGVTGTYKSFTSNPLKTLNLAVSKMVASTYTTGRVSFKAYLVKPLRGRANGAVLFSIRSNTAYRYVELIPGKVAIGQTTTLGGQAALRKEFATTLSVPARWLAVTVDLTSNGTVKVRIGTKQVAAYRFTKVVPGKVGLRALAVKSLFDNFMVQNAYVFQP